MLGGLARTGRAGATGDALSLCSPNERKQLADIEKLIKRPLEVQTLALDKPARHRHDERNERGERGERDFGDLGPGDPRAGGLVEDGVGVLDRSPDVVIDGGDCGFDLGVHPYGDRHVGAAAAIDDTEHLEKARQAVMASRATLVAGLEQLVILGTVGAQARHGLQASCARCPRARLEARLRS